MIRQLNFNVGGDPNGDTPFLIADNPPGGTLLSSHFEGVPGELPNRFVADVPMEVTGGATLYYQGGRKSFRVIVPPAAQGQWEANLPPCIPPEYNGDVEKVALKYSPAAVILAPLVRNGQFYYNPDGSPFTVIETSAFRLYEYYLNGADITPFLGDVQALGFNTLRVWLLNTSVGHILPSEHPDFYARLHDFLGLCGAHNLYVEFTVFTQTQTLMPALADQQHHLDSTLAGVGDAFCFIEGVNENDANDNRIDPALQFHKPAGATFDLCRGSNGSDSWVVEPVLESARYHSNDANEWQRRCAHNAMEMADAFNVSAFANENTRPDHDGNPVHFFDAAAGAALLHAGSCYHCNDGKNAEIFKGQDRDFAVQWVAGAKSIDLSQRVYGYVHRSDLENSQVIRAYQRGSQVVLIHV